MLAVELVIGHRV